VERPTVGKIMKLQAIRRLCNRLQPVIMLNGWQINESWICWLRRIFNPEVKSCVCDKQFLGTWRQWTWI